MWSEIISFSGELTSYEDVNVHKSQTCSDFDRLIAKGIEGGKTMQQSDGSQGQTETKKNRLRWTQ